MPAALNFARNRVETSHRRDGPTSFIRMKVCIHPVASFASPTAARTGVTRAKKGIFMRKYLLAATVIAPIAAPALAGAPGPYVGIEGGVTFPHSSDLDVVLNNTTVSPPTTATYGNGFNVDYKTGYDLDAIAGYKLGLFRLEVEGGYKHAKVKDLNVSTPLLTDVGTAAGVAATAADFNVGDHIGIKTLMANALLDGDFGGGFGGYVG